MTYKVRYELPVFSQALICNPDVKFEDMNVIMTIRGYDEEDNEKTITVTFVSVLCMKKTSVRFTPELYDSYDKVVELIDSDWLNELKKINENEFGYWKPKHYVLYLGGEGMYQFIAQDFKVIDSTDQ